MKYVVVLGRSHFAGRDSRPPSLTSEGLRFTGGNRSALSRSPELPITLRARSSATLRADGGVLGTKSSPRRRGPDDSSSRLYWPLTGHIGAQHFAEHVENLVARGRLPHSDASMHPSSHAPPVSSAHALDGRRMCRLLATASRVCTKPDCHRRWLALRPSRRQRAYAVAHIPSVVARAASRLAQRNRLASVRSIPDRSPLLRYRPAVTRIDTFCLRAGTPCAQRSDAGLVYLDAAHAAP